MLIVLVAHNISVRVDVQDSKKMNGWIVVEPDILAEAMMVAVGVNKNAHTSWCGLISKNMYKFLFFLFVSQINRVIAQSIRVPLHLVVSSNSPFLPLEHNLYKDIRSLEEYKLPVGLTKPVVHTFSLSKQQSLIDSYRKGRVPDSIFFLTLKTWNVDTINYPYQQPNYKANFLTGMRNNGEVVVIPDLNCNKNFNDDYEFRLEITNRNKKSKFSITNLLFKKMELPRDGKLYNLDFPLSINVDVGSSMNDINMHLLDNTYTLGCLEDSNKRFNVYFKTYDLGKLFSSGDELLIIGEKEIVNGPSLNQYVYNIGDTCLIGTSFYQFESLSALKDTVSFRYIGQRQSDTWYTTGYRFPPLKLYNINTHNILNIPEKRKAQFLLIDFMASWCRPCLQKVPFLKTLEKKSNGQLNLISISIDKVEDLPALLAVKKKYRIDWPLLYDKDANSPSIKRFKFNSIPFYILLDSENRIIYRGSDEKLMRNILDKKSKIVI
jgi:thiol-disulfide isomerase/thioredoxin